jgi:hypothetical protein
MAGVATCVALACAERLAGDGDGAGDYAPSHGNPEGA